jgi:hypothetical protein
MPPGARPILVDTNVILEGYRTGSWRALVGRFRVETVTDCVTETQTGAQKRRPEQRIDPAELRLAAVHDVTDTERAVALTRDDLVRFLDPGEQALWAHALGRDDTWLLCGPDKASLRLGVRLGFRDRMVAFEALLDDAGHRPRVPLRLNYTRAWLATCLAELAQQEGKGPA